MKGLRNIAPYTPGDQPQLTDMIKINTNENPYPPSPKVTDCLAQLDVAALRRYPTLTNTHVKTLLAEKYQLQTENILVANGSDEALAFSFLAFFNSADPVLFPEITYGFYRVWCELFHIPAVEIPLDDHFQIPLTAFQQTNGGIVIANPNAPTGHYYPSETILAFVKDHADVVVIVDEAYIEFGGDSLAPFVNDYENLVVIQTLSKSHSLAGLRVGFAFAHPKLIAIAEAVKNSFNPYSVDMIADQLAAAALTDAAYYQKINKQICATRTWFTKELAALGFTTLPSMTNFVLTTHPTLESRELYEQLMKKHVFVRYFTTPATMSRYLRISIGTPAEMEKVLILIKEILAPLK